MFPYGRMQWGLLMPGKHSRMTRRLVCDRRHSYMKNGSASALPHFLCFILLVFQILNHWGVLVVCAGIADEGDQREYHIHGGDDGDDSF